MGSFSEASEHWEQERPSMFSDRYLSDVLFDDLDMELDEDTREYLVWFEADVEDSYRSEAKIKSRIVDMDWLTQQEQRSRTATRSAPPPKDENATVSKRLVHEVKTAASLGEVADEPIAEVPKSPLEPSPPTAARGGRGNHRPHKRRLSDSPADGAAGAARDAPAAEVQIVASETPQMSQVQPTPPTAPLEPSTAALGRLRRVMCCNTISTVSTSEGAEEKDSQEKAKQQREEDRSCQLALELPMAGSPANALRRVVRAVIQHRRFMGPVS